MRHNDQILWALDNSIQPADFERLCVDLLGREGYRHLIPVGGTKDHGRDAELSYLVGTSDDHKTIAFQFSLEKRWERKLLKDAAKIAGTRPEVTALVFATSQNATGVKQDNIRGQFQSAYGWATTFYPREWFRHRLTELHQDLAKVYLGIILPPTPGYAVTQFEVAPLDDYGLDSLFEHTPPQLLRALIAARTDNEPHRAIHWYQLGRIEYVLRNYDAAMVAVDRALRLTRGDRLLELNVNLFKSTLLAEKGIQARSRPLLIQARDLLLNALPGKRRSADHYNLGNILGALDETVAAKREYLQCLRLEPRDAKAWKNLGSLLAKEGENEEALRAFDKAIALNPKLVEAYLCKANICAIVQNKPDEAVKCFETAKHLRPHVYEEWPYVGYWYGKALSAVGRDADALAEIDDELAFRPDDQYLLDQKLELLSRLRRTSLTYRQKARQFLEFRIEAIPFDFIGLAEFISLLSEDGDSASAWNYIDKNLRCEPFAMSRLARAAGVKAEHVQQGLRYGRLYGVLRRKFSVEDYCVSLHSQGLSPNNNLIRALELALIGPFGKAANALDSRLPPDDILQNMVAYEMLESVGHLFTSIGAEWIGPKPETKDEQIRLLAIAIANLPDFVVAETARLVGFLKATVKIKQAEIFPHMKPNWAEVYADIAAQLLSIVGREWDLGASDYPASPSVDPSVGV